MVIFEKINKNFKMVTYINEIHIYSNNYMRKLLKVFKKLY